MKATICAGALLLLSGTAFADEISIPMGGVSVDHLSVVYDCGGERLSVDYWNAGETSLAAFEIDGRTAVMAAGIAASGVRYAGGRHVWWTKGDEASLYDAAADDEAGALKTCRAVA